MSKVDEGPRTGPQTRWLTAAALMGLAVIASLTLCEIVVRLFLPQRLYYNISQWDADVGFVNIPNIRSVQRNREYEMTIQVNWRGLRDREFPFAKPARTVRIGVFGDSFTLGEGVEGDQTYSKRLERLFADDPRLAAAGWRVEVLNFGIGKTGTSQQLAWYRKEGARYHLDLVVLGFFVGNDFNDNLRGVYHLSRGQLVHDRTAYSSVRRIQSVLYAVPGYRWLAEHSHLLNLARVAGTVLDDRARMARATPTTASAAGERAGYAVALTQQLIVAFAGDARANGSQFVLLYFPARDERPLGDYQGDDSIKPYVSRLAQLQDRLGHAPFEQVDFVPIFAKLPAKSYYYVVDSHWRPAGHDVVARRLFERLSADIYARATGTVPTSRVASP